MDNNGEQSTGGSTPNESTFKEFLECGRTGRRNAVPDIKDESTALLSKEFDKLSCVGNNQRTLGSTAQEDNH
ncbi:cAMP-dependent protein kinase inhibitor gamma-like isoform X2 [Tachypleus tridentatus]|uniref:cAMP-dependent protein kinase inhibitor gamma-like isoform X2 n=1 Tax=Tachypleus tridentatus TaxID=6853 RepID=UPI003FD32335